MSTPHFKKTFDFHKVGRLPRTVQMECKSQLFGNLSTLCLEDHVYSTPTYADS